VVFDPVSGFFLIASSLANSLVVLNPDTQQATSLRVGINPTSLAFNFQSSTLVTVNTASNTVSVMDFQTERVRAILGLTGSPQFAVDIHPRTNLAVIADQNNNRVLLVPLPR
jgi:DNA-binding beta-propeller fold protein YncE